MSCFTVTYIYLTIGFVIYEVKKFTEIFVISERKENEEEMRLWCDRIKWREIRAEKI